MRATRLALAATVVLALACAILAAAGPQASKPQWQRYLTGEDTGKAAELAREQARLQAAGKFDEALKVAQSLADLRTKAQGADHWQTVDARHQVTAIRQVLKQDAAGRKEYADVALLQSQSAALQARGRYREAETLQAKSLAIYRKVLGEEHPVTALAYNNLANIQHSQGKYAQADESLRNALVIWRKVLGEDHPETARGYNNLAIGLRAQGRYPQAEAACRKALTIRRKVLGEEHSDTAGSYNSLGNVQNAQARYAQAEESYRKALAITRKLLGEEHALTAQSYNNLGVGLDAQGKYTEAEKVHRKALAVRRKVFGEEHPTTAESYNNLAMNQNAQNNYEEAEKNLRKALAIRQRLLGEEHPRTAISYNNLAYNLNAQGRYADADKNYRKALAIYRKALGEEHTHTALGYSNLANNHNTQGDYIRAEEGYRRALAISRKVHGEEHPVTATSYNNLANNQMSQGKYVQAEEGFRKALDIYRKVYGEEHLSTTICYGNLANNQNAQRKHATAEESLRKLLAVSCKIHGEEHLNTATIYYHLAACLHDQRKHDQAEPFLRKALTIFRKIRGEEHHETAKSYDALATNLEDQGKYAEAERTFHKALAICRKVLGEAHLETALAYNSLASNQLAQGRYVEAEEYFRKGADRFDKVRGRIASSGLDRAARTSKDSPLSRFAALLARNDKPAAWQRFEQSLGRGTWDDLSARLRRPAAERDKQSALVARLDRLDRLVERSFSVKKPTDEQLEQRKELLTQQRQTQEALNDFMADLEKRYGPVGGQVLDRAAIQAALPADAALIGWIDIPGQPKAKDPNGEHWAVLLRSAGEPVFVRLPRSGGKGEWNAADRLPADLRAALQNDRGVWQPLAQRLRKQRLSPLAEHLKATDRLPAVRRLIVLPSPALAGVPVEVFAEDYTVSYALSGTLFAHLRKQLAPKSKGLLALGDPVFDVPAGAAEPPLPPGGVLLTAVTPGGNAARAGLRPNDELLSYAGKTLTRPADHQAAMETADKAPITVRVWRDGETFSRRVAPGKLGVVVANDPAPKALAEQRRLDRRLASRGGEEDKWAQLPGTRAEVEALARLFGKEPAPLLLFDSSASEQRLSKLAKRRELGRYRYVHLATHGEVDNRLPLRSAVILSRDDLPDAGKQLDAGLPIFDGRLTAREVLEDWRLDSDLVTLSACQTALGKYERGEGFIGFAQALILSGSRAVCLSLWKVDDAATALLMERFYQNLLGKRDGLKTPLPKAEALKEAKDWLHRLPREQAVQRLAGLTKGVARGKGRKMQPLLPAPPAAAGGAKEDDRPYAHPYWAAFVLIGDEH
jgi:tetratricopeptide (TPR) repeat protein